MLQQFPYLVEKIRLIEDEYQREVEEVGTFADCQQQFSGLHQPVPTITIVSVVVIQ